MPRMHRRSPLWLQAARLAAWTLAGVVALPVVLAILFRTGARRPLRTLNRRFLNPLTLHAAGRGGPYAVLRHTGRRSGARYATPLVADRTADGFLIPLVYGEDVDWAKNVLAAGRASIEFEGITYAATTPRIVPFAEAAPHLRRGLRARYRFYGVEHFLRVHAEAAESVVASTATTSAAA